jgi:2,6-dihydroxypseudooxynicotine hydrolase
MTETVPVAAGKEAVDKTIRATMHRMLSDGVNYRDLLEIQSNIQGPQDWCRSWMAAADIHETIARKVLREGHQETASQALARASLYCHFAQGYYTYDRPAERLQAEKRRQVLFREAAPILTPPLEYVEITFARTRIPAYLRLPVVARTKSPCVVLIGGLDTTKEDALALTNVLVERGMATLAFDGPGQGAMYEEMGLISDFEKAVSAIIDYLQQRSEINAERIGVMGRSTGGHFALRAAAHDKRLRAAAAWGLIYDVDGLASFPADVRDRFIRAAKLKSVDEAREFYKTYDLDGHVRQIHCPVMIVQGGQDPLVAPGGLERFNAQAVVPVELMFFADSGHCCHDRGHIVKPAMADFLATHLLVDQSESNSKRKPQGRS